MECVIVEWPGVLPEGLHVSVEDSLVHGGPLGPGPLELGDQLLIHRAPAQWRLLQEQQHVQQHGQKDVK